MASIADLSLYYSGGVDNDDPTQSLGGLQSSAKFRMKVGSPSYNPAFGITFLDSCHSNPAITESYPQLELHSLIDGLDKGLQARIVGDAAFGGYVDVSAGGNFCLTTADLGGGATYVLVNVDPDLLPTDSSYVIDQSASGLSLLPSSSMFTAVSGSFQHWCLFMANENLIEDLVVNITAVLPQGSAIAGQGVSVGAGETEVYVPGGPEPTYPYGSYYLYPDTPMTVTIPAGESIPIWFSVQTEAGFAPEQGSTEPYRLIFSKA